MDKLKRLLVAGAAGALLMLVALPNTRWTILNGVDVLAGKWSQNAFGVTGAPSFAFAPKLDVSQFRSPYAGDSAAVVDRLAVQTQKEPSNAVARAHLLRYVSMAPAGPIRKMPNDRTPTATVLENNRKRAERWQKAILPAREGAKLEPANAYFPMMEAAALITTGDMKGAHEAWTRASECTEYDDHAIAEPEENIRLYEAQYGYRGEVVKTVFLASVVLPHYASHRRVAELLRDESSSRLEARASSVRLGRLLIDHGDVLICVFVGRNLIDASLSDKPRDIYGLKPVDKDAQRLSAADLSQKFRKAGFQKAASDLDALFSEKSPYRELDKPNIFMFDDGFGGLESLSPFALAASLAGLVLLPALAPLSVPKRRPVPLSAHWVWTSLPFLFFAVPGLEPYTVFSVVPMVFLVLERRTDGLLKVCSWLGWVTALGMLGLWSAPSFAGLAYAIAFFLGRSHRDREASLWAGLVWLLFGALAVAGVYVLSVSGQSGFSGWIGLGAVAAAMVWVRPLAGHKAKDVLSLGLPAIVLCLAASVIWVLRTNEQIRAQNQAWLQEVEVVRAKAGLG